MVSKMGPLEVGELCSENDLQKLFEKYNFIGVIHLAALSNVSKKFHLYIIKITLLVLII